MMGPDVDCPVCGAYRVRPGVEMCSVCETAHRLDKRIVQLEAERDALRARVAFLEREHEEAMGDAELRSSVNAYEEEVCQLSKRLAELAAPPVVPEGWEVRLDITSWDRAWRLHGDGVGPVAYIDGDGWLVIVDGQANVAPWLALAALEHAHRTGQRPPHAGDE